MIGRTMEDFRAGLWVRSFLWQRDESSFHKLYRHYSPGLFPIALRMLQWREADAEDALQECWLRAIQKIGEFRWEASLRTWLTGILLNCCHEIVRRTNESLNHSRATELNSVQKDPTIDMDLENAIAALPDGCRAVLILHDIEGYTHGEIAGLLKIEIGTSKSQLSYARKSLRATFRKEGSSPTEVS